MISGKNTITERGDNDNWLTIQPRYEITFSLFTSPIHGGIMGKNMKLAVVLSLFVMAVSGNLIGQQWDTLGLQGLDVTDITLHSSAPDSVFAIVADTIYKSTDGGAPFHSVCPSTVANRDLVAVGISAADPVWVVAGDEGSLLGTNAKIFQSTDGGRTWAEAPATLPSKVQALAADPFVRGTALFGTPDGVFEILTQLDTLDCGAVAYDPTDDSTLYEGLKQGNGVGKSTDGGANWIYYTDGFPAVSFSVLDVAVNPLNNQDIYATAQWTELASAIVYEMFRSVDGGESWTALGWQQDLNTQDLAIDPTQGFIFIGHTGGLTIHPLGEGVFQSITSDLPANQVHALAISEAQKVVASTNTGVYSLDYFPDLSWTYKSIVEISGDGDGIPDPGETVDLIVGLINSLFDGSDISVTLSVINDPTVTVTKDTATYPDIPANSSSDNSADPFTLVIDAAADTHFVDLQLDITANGGSYSTTDTMSLMIGAPTILFIDDDGGAAYDTFLVNTMDSMAVAYDVWDMQIMGPLTTQLQQPTLYHAVIWMSGDEEEGILTTQDINVLTNYMAEGGRLILTGQNLVEDLDNGGNPDPFLTDVLHISYRDTVVVGRLLFGVEGDVLGDQIERCLIIGGNGAYNQNDPDAFTIEPDSLARPFLTYITPPGAVGAIHVEDPATAAQAIVLGFGFEAVNRTTPTDTATVTRGQLLSIMLDQLQPAVGIGDDGNSGEIELPRVFTLGQNYPNPFNPSTTIEFTVPAKREGREHVVLKIYNLRGQLVKTLVDDGREGGQYIVRWGGKDDNGADVGSGIYLYKISVGDYTAARKMVLLK